MFLLLCMTFFLVFCMLICFVALIKNKVTYQIQMRALKIRQQHEIAKKHPLKDYNVIFCNPFLWTFKQAYPSLYNLEKQNKE